MFWYPKYWATFGYILKNVTFEVKPNVANFYFNIWSHLPRLTWCLLISTNCTSKFNLRYRQLLLTSIRYNIVICTLRLNLVSLRRRRMPLEWFENVNRLWRMRQIRNLSKQFNTSLTHSRRVQKIGNKMYPPKGARSVSPITFSRVTICTIYF